MRACGQARACAESDLRSRSSSVGAARSRAMAPDATATRIAVIASLASA